ncbi:PepSY domain-containing protein [Bacillus chungangensis]|uniref:Membrane protein YkoI n=1 Tax=Bacillus chungangensis TaxID=587633 RepID=A0ABT9WQP4_9BACI|nr:PepSY domain-containing protein [Bacillus chungangensis]MDQ0175611.1 putative membrane protein YkoI [Bacillus chungangensis]
MKKKIYNILGAFLLIGLITACANNNTPEDASPDRTQQDQNTDQNQNTEQDQKQEEDLETIDFKLSTDEALEIAKEKSEGDVTELGVEKENNRYVYKIEMMTDTEETEVKIDADTGDILKEITEPLDQDEINTERQRKKIDLTNTIGHKKAISIAKKEENGNAIEWMLKRENGPTYYEIDLLDERQNEFEIKVDAQSGNVLEVDKND